MKMQSKVSALVLSLVLFAASGLAHAEFTSGMTEEQADVEVKAQLKAGKSMDEIVAAAKVAGVPAVRITAALIRAEQAADVVVEKVTAANKSEAGPINRVATQLAPKDKMAIGAATARGLIAPPPKVTKDTNSLTDAVGNSKPTAAGKGAVQTTKAQSNDVPPSGGGSTESVRQVQKEASPS